MPKLIFPTGLCLLFVLRIAAQGDPQFFTPGEDLVKKTEKYLFIKVSVDKQKAYQGEAVVAEYRLYVAVDLQGKLSKAPSFSGFASFEMEQGNNDTYDVEKRNGILFKVYLIRKLQLFGLQPGRQRLEPIELDVHIRYRKKSTTGMNTYGGLSEPGNDTLVHTFLQSEPLDIVINPLPSTNDPFFTGATGDFRIRMDTQKGMVPAGKADTVHIILEGTGNWHEIIFPALIWPDGLEVFEPTINEVLDTRSVPVSGSRILSYPVMANKPGDYVIPPVHFTWFNPQKQKYETAQTQSLTWKVTKTLPELQENGRQKKALPATNMFSNFVRFIFPIAAVLLLLIVFWKRPRNKAEEK